MIMGLPVRCRYWSVLQVVAIVICYRGKVSSEIAEGCVGSQLNLTCEEAKVIQITNVVLRDSDCGGASWRTSHDDCTRNANENHTSGIHGTCDNKESCTVTVVQEEIPCGFFRGPTESDFERIIYSCESDPRYIAQGCVGSKLNLTCEEMKVIQIISVVLGESDCNGASCCIKYNDCTRNANANHITDVHRGCDNRKNCSVDAIQKRISCGALKWWTYNDFERITYICIAETRNGVMNPEAEQVSTEGDDNADHESEMVEGCVGTQLDLTCGENKVISIIAVIVGDSYGIGSACYIKSDDCTRNANESHTMDVHSRCNGQINCTIDVFKETIPCWFKGRDSTNDFERITYDCVYDQQRTPTSVPSRPNLYATDYSSENERTNEALPVIVVITCLVILLAIIILILFVIYRRKHRAQVKSFNPVAMTEVDNQQNESNIYPNGNQTTSPHESIVPLSVPLVDEDPPVYSDMVWKDGLNNSTAADQPKAAIQAHMTGPDVYTEVNKPSKTTATASALETGRVGGTGPVKTGDCLPDQIYSLASNDVGNIYANEPAADSETVSLQDDDGQTVIENDLYSH